MLQKVTVSWPETGFEASYHCRFMETPRALGQVKGRKMWRKQAVQTVQTNQVKTQV